MLKGRVALVTGSTSGIGRAMAEKLAAHGAAIMLNGFGDAAEIEALRHRIADACGVPVAYHGADMFKPDEIADLVAATERELGPVDILINNAGIQHTALTEDFPPEKWDAILAINLSAAFHTTHLTVAGMKRRGWGRIINTASVHGLIASVEKSAYTAAKHGIIGLTKVVALETATSGVTCNAICPGFVGTELIEPQIMARAAEVGGGREEGVRALLSAKQPSLTMVEPEQIGDIVVFLCLPAASQITGIALPVDGGWTAQ